MHTRGKHAAHLPFDPSARLPAAILAVVAASGWFASWAPLWIAALVLLAVLAFFSRDPERSAVAPPDAILSPADGRVIEVRDMAASEVGASEGPCISIFLSVFDAHINRAPYPGVVEAVVYRPGGHHDARRPDATANESNWILLRCGKHYMTVRQIAGRFARRVICRVPKGAAVDRGDRIGFIRLGSRVELYLPAGTGVVVQPGQHVRGGHSIVAYLQKTGTRS
jgi:phosphatidylserine decarboxylase